jgi:hypothetical protein
MAAAAELGQLKIDDFSHLEDKTFEIQTADGGVPLELVASTANATTVPAGTTGPKNEVITPRGGEGFTLQFIAPQDFCVPQAIYPMTHPKLGALEIFLVPGGPLRHGHGYNAVFT